MLELPQILNLKSAGNLTIHKAFQLAPASLKDLHLFAALRAQLSHKHRVQGSNQADKSYITAYSAHRDTMDQAARGKKALGAGQYDEAIIEFTAALQTSPTSPDYLIQRSIAYLRAKKYHDALADANHAITNAIKRAKREQIIEGQFRRGVALYSLERYGDADFVFNLVKQKDEKHKMVPTWLQKTKLSLERLDEDDEKRQSTIKEIPQAGDRAVKSNGEAGTSNTSTTTHEAASSSAAPAPAAPQQTAADKIRHEWYQNSQNVYFTLLAKGVPKDKAQIDIQERSLNISFPLVTGSSYDFTLDPLFGPVNPEKSVKTIYATKIEVILAKATPGHKWSSLETSAAAVQAGTYTDG